MTILIPIFVLVWVAIPVGIYFSEKNTFFGWLAVAGFFVGMVLTPISIVSDRVVSSKVKQAQTIKTFDNISIKAPDWPEQFSTNVNFLDKPVQVVETTYANSWGLGVWKGYTVQVIPVEN